MNTNRRRLTTLVAGLLFLGLSSSGGAHTEPVTTYSGSATAIDITLSAPPAADSNVNFAKTQEYQDSPSFTETQQHANQSIGPFPDPTNNMVSGAAREVFAMTEGGTLLENVATSMAVITDLSDMQLSPSAAGPSLLDVSADVILSNTRAECNPNDPSIALSGDSLIGNLDIQFNGSSVTGGPVNVDAPPNQVIAEVPGVFKVIANEQVASADTIEVTALHIIVYNPNPAITKPLYDVKLARSKSDISSCPPRVMPKPGERMDGKGAVRWPDGTEAFFCYWCAIDAQGAVAGNLYVFDNSDTGVVIQNWWEVSEFSNPDSSTSFPLTRQCTFKDSDVTSNATNASTTEDCRITGTDSGATDGTDEYIIIDCDSYDSEGPLEYGDVQVTPGS